jgi:hypothetical protein
MLNEKEKNLRAFGKMIMKLAGGRDLSRSETRECYCQVILNKQPELQQGAFLMSHLIKGPTTEELCGAWGGEGNNVFFVQSVPELDTCLDLAGKWEGQGKKGFVIQEYIPSAGRSLRVVVIGSRFISYWRTHQDQNSFYSNISRGAEIDKDNDPDLQEAAVRELKKFCERTKINLAGFDFLFDSRQKKPKPLFLEINYFFRCHGLGGTDRYFELLVEAVNEWLAEINKVV